MLPSRLLLDLSSGFPTKTLYVLFFSPMLATYIAQSYGREILCVQPDLLYGDLGFHFILKTVY
jgi:hypothetical protein